MSASEDRLAGLRLGRVRVILCSNLNWKSRRRRNLKSRLCTEADSEIQFSESLKLGFEYTASGLCCTEPEYLPSSLLEIIHQASNLSDVLFVPVTRNHFGVEVEFKPRNSNLELKSRCILAAQRRAWPLEAIRDNQHTKFESKRRYKNDPLLSFKFYFQNRKRRSGASDPGRQPPAYSAESNFTVAPLPHCSPSHQPERVHCSSNRDTLPRLLGAALRDLGRLLRPGLPACR